MLRSDCVLQKEWKERPKRIFLTMVQLAFTWCFPILKICSRKVLPRNHRSSMGEKCSCDFWDMLVCGVPCGKAVNYQTTAVPSISGTWILAPTSCVSSHFLPGCYYYEIKWFPDSEVQTSSVCPWGKVQFEDIFFEGVGEQYQVHFPGRCHVDRQLSTRQIH